MTDQLPPNQLTAPASAAPAGNASAAPEQGSPTRATSPRTQGLDPILQSQLDKRDQRFMTEIQRLTALVEKLQTPTAPAASTETPPAPPPAPPSQPSAPASAPAAEPGRPATPEAEASPTPATLAAWSLMDAEGVDIDDSDPEKALIDWSDPKKAAQTTKAAIDAKRKRQANGALPISGGQAVFNPIEGITDPAELLKRAFAKRS